MALLLNTSSLLCAIFDHLPLDIFIHCILPCIARDWLFVSHHWHHIAFRKLLSDNRIQPAANKNHAIRKAGKHGHVRVVELLLSDPRVDPADGNDYAIQWAAHNGHFKVVELLLADIRVDPAASGNCPIRWAAHNGHVKVVELLLANSRVNPAAAGSYTVRHFSGRRVVCEHNMDPPDPTYPTRGNNFAICWASRNGHFNIVALLLADRRVNPAADNNFAIRYAAQEGHLAVVELLLKDSRVDPAADGTFAACIRWAILKGHND